MGLKISPIYCVPALAVAFLLTLPAAAGYTYANVDDGNGGTVLIAVDVNWVGNYAHGSHWAPPPGVGTIQDHCGGTDPYQCTSPNDSCETGLEGLCSTNNGRERACGVDAMGKTFYGVFVFEVATNCA